MIEIEAKELFEGANRKFLERSKVLIERRVSERNLCGELKSCLEQELKDFSIKGYYVDVEYNRNDEVIKRYKHTTSNLGAYKLKQLTCDLIVHSRGEKGLNSNNDNLIAIEMKKNTGKQSIEVLNKAKEADRKRLMALTNNYEEGKGSVLKYVCGYALEIFYEIDYAKQVAEVEYFRKGKSFSKDSFPILDNEKG